MTAKKMGSNMAGISRSKQILKDIQIVVKTRRNLVFLKVYFHGFHYSPPIHDSKYVLSIKT